MLNSRCLDLSLIRIPHHPGLPEITFHFIFTNGAGCVVLTASPGLHRLLYPLGLSPMNFAYLTDRRRQGLIIDCPPPLPSAERMRKMEPRDSTSVRRQVAAAGIISFLFYFL